MTKNVILEKAFAAHEMLMDAFYREAFKEGAHSCLLETANKLADPLGDNLTEEDIASIITECIATLGNEIKYSDDVEKLYELL